jgi:GntR family transcriptional regulator
MDLNSTREIDRRSPIPFYVQLRMNLIEAIQKQSLSAGDRFPSDHELANHFQLSRSVVRQTMAELETEGVVTRLRGKGTFLEGPKVSEGLAGWTGGLAEDTERRGSTVHSDVIRLERTAADGRISDLLRLHDSTDVYVLERVRSVDGEPWSHTISWMPSHLVPGIDEVDFSTASLYDTLKVKYGLVLDRARRSVEAALAGETTGRYLGIGSGDPVLRLTSVQFDPSGRPIETFVAYHRGDRSRFDVDLESAAVRGRWPVSGSGMVADSTTPEADASN